MSNLNSANIRVFPLGQSRDSSTGFQDDRYLSERNLTQMLSRFVDEESYVLRFNKNTAPQRNSDNSSLEFVLNGYYINWLKVDTALETNNSECVYANIVLQNDAMQGDNNGEFEGVDIQYKSRTDVAPSGSLLLLVKNDDGITWDIPIESKFKHSGESLFITKTEGREKRKVSAQKYIEDCLNEYLSTNDANQDGYADGELINILQKYFGTSHLNDTPLEEYKEEGLIEQKIDTEISQYKDLLKWKKYS